MEVESYLCHVCSKYRDMFVHVLYWLCCLHIVPSDVSQCLETFFDVFRCIYVEDVNRFLWWIQLGNSGKGN